MRQVGVKGEEHAPVGCKADRRDAAMVVRQTAFSAEAAAAPCKDRTHWGRASRSAAAVIPVPLALAPRVAAAAGFASVVPAAPALVAAAEAALAVVALLPVVAVRPPLRAVLTWAPVGSTPQLTGMIKSALARVEPSVGASLHASLTAVNLGLSSVNHVLSPAAAGDGAAAAEFARCSAAPCAIHWRTNSFSASGSGPVAGILPWPTISHSFDASGLPGTTTGAVLAACHQRSVKPWSASPWSWLLHCGRPSSCAQTSAECLRHSRPSARLRLLRRCVGCAIASGLGFDTW